MDVMSQSPYNAEVVNESFVQALRPYREFTPLIEGIAASLGAWNLDELANPARFPVMAWWIDPADEVFTSWVMTPSSLVLHQRSKVGVCFNLIVPVDRLRRVSEEINADASRRLTIEIDADRVVTESVTMPGDNGSTRTSGASLSASYVLVADPARVAELDRFARELRRALL